MGILNVTPDSFSDGGRYFDPETALRRGLEMVDQGADLVDIGGESTRPGSDAVSAEDEWRRVRAVIEGLAAKADVPLSIDTMKPEVAAHAIDAGVSVVNDVSGMRDVAMVRLVAARRVGVVAMHMLGNPKTMQEHPTYADVVEDVRAFLAERVRGLEAAGVPSDAIAIDPGVGFGKSVAHNLALLRHLDRLVDLGHPVVVGVSRKAFIERLGGGEVGDRLAGSLAAATLAVARGAQIVRVHDVAETVRAMRVADALARDEKL
jgi:dihydropteroate synthase